MMCVRVCELLFYFVECSIQSSNSEFKQRISVWFHPALGFKIPLVTYQRNRRQETSPRPRRAQQMRN